MWHAIVQTKVVQLGFASGHVSGSSEAVPSEVKVWFTSGFTSGPVSGSSEAVPSEVKVWFTSGFTSGLVSLYEAHQLGPLIKLTN